MWQGVLALIVLGSLAFAYVGLNREEPSGTDQKSEEVTQTDIASSDPLLRNRMKTSASPSRSFAPASCSEFASSIT